MAKKKYTKTTASGGRPNSSHSFARVPTADIPRSVFSRNHSLKTTFDAGYLVPFFVDEALPGDTFRLNASMFARLATPIVPIMDNLYMETFFFAVPLRLVWDNFEKFMGAQDNPGDSTDYLIPSISNGTLSNVRVGTLWDYFGLPTANTGQVYYTTQNPISALYFRAYNLIWNEWFRDQNLQDSVYTSRGDGPDDLANYKLLRRGKRHDYFTSCLPWPQKGPGVELPLGGVAPVSYQPVPGGVLPRMRFAATGVLPSPGSSQTLQVTPGNTVVHGNNNNPLLYDPGDTLYADLSTATAATINSLRQAFQLQRLLERDARGGTRYTEIIQSHFRVRSPDSRLQRPEYLGGGRSMIHVMPVPQTSSTNPAVTPQGNLAGFGTATSGRNGFNKSFTEHSIVIGLVNVRADLTYQQGTPRMFTRRTKYDFYWPALAHLGEQAVLNREIYHDFTDDSPTNKEVFGYQERWSEYRYAPSRITGQFRSTYPQTLDIWHLAQKFDSLPLLNSTFIEDKPPVDRISAVPSEPDILLDVFFDFRTARPMPTYSVPGLIDHF